MTNSLPTDSPQGQNSAPESITLVAFPTELLRVLQVHTARVEELFLSEELRGPGDQALWEAVGELEPHQMKVLELLAQVSLDPADSIQKD